MNRTIVKAHDRYNAVSTTQTWLSGNENATTPQSTVEYACHDYIVDERFVGSHAIFAKLGNLVRYI